MPRDPASGLYLPPGVGHDSPVVVPPSGCEYCDSLLKKMGTPDVCAACSEPIWQTKVPGEGVRHVQFEGHRFITKNVNATSGQKRRGHRAFLEVHTKERCQYIRDRATWR